MRVHAPATVAEPFALRRLRMNHATIAERPGVALNAFGIAIAGPEREPAAAMKGNSLIEAVTDRPLLVLQHAAILRGKREVATLMRAALARVPTVGKVGRHLPLSGGEPAGKRKVLIEI